MLAACEAEGLRVVLHTHDEVAIETDDPEEDSRKLLEIMMRPMAWLDGRSPAR